MRPDVDLRILDAAIEVFSESGYGDANARELARRAKTTTMTIYRSFKNKEGLFHECLREVIARSFDPGKFALLMYEDSKSRDAGAILNAALLRWYSSLPRSSARLLAQAWLSRNPKWHEMADAALDSIISILATTMERQLPKKQQEKGEARIAAKTAIIMLFHLRMTSPKPASPKKEEKEQTREAETFLHYWWQRGPAPAV